MTRFIPIVCTLLFVLLMHAIAKAEDAVSRDPKAGIYVIWYPQSQADMYLSQQYVVGGQVVLQWADVEPSRGNYDFTKIDKALADLDQRGLQTTLQINGNRKPHWLKDVVPALRQKLSVQVSDDSTLMYWHPTHRDAYLSMLRALGSHLAKSPYRDALIGIRLNFNAIGTEHTQVESEHRELNAWDFPESVSRNSTECWTPEIRDRYVAAVVDTYIAAFDNVCRILVRNGVPQSVEDAYRDRFENGSLSWFQTSSEVEPRAAGTETRYMRFYRDCRSGKTTAYAEPWASCWGHHGGKCDDRWCSPSQWMYWRILSDLHCGVSYIALYANDMRVAIDGTYPYQGQNLAGTNVDIQSEFDQAIRFASRYAGYHALPKLSPGAWVAMRENAIVRAENGMSEKQRTLSELTGDYNFLMHRLPGDRSVGQDVVNVGPDEQRFGAWARRLPQGDTMRFAVDQTFANSLQKPATVAVTYLREPGVGFVLTIGNCEYNDVMSEGDQRWHTVEFDAPAGHIQSQEGASIRLKAIGGDLLLHMIEVRR